MLLPPDLHDKVTDNHVVKFAGEAVTATDKQDALLNQHGTGSEQYPPAMMPGLLLYCCATGLFSSRKIEEHRFYTGF